MNLMDTNYDDINIVNSFDRFMICHIINFLDDKAKRIILSVNHYFNNLQKDIYYYELHNYETIGHLSYYDSFKQVKYIARDSFIPKGVTHLIFQNYIPDITIGSIPDSVKEITFDDGFNKPIQKEYFPSGLRYLKFGQAFSQIIKNNLPDNLETLIVGLEFKQSIQGALPSTLKKLELHNVSDISDCLPSGLENLVINHHDLNGDICKHLPAGLKSLTINSNYYVEISGKLPETLEYLNLRLQQSQLRENIIPPNVKHLVLDGSYNENIMKYIPSSVVKLELLGDDFFDISGLASSIEYLRLSNSFDENIIGCLPTNLKELILGHSFNSSIKNALPEGLKRITFGTQFNQEICAEDMPESLERIEFGDNFNQDMNNRLTKLTNLTTLIFGDNFDKDIQGLPNSLTQLVLGRKFNRRILNLIPIGVTHLTLGKCFSQKIQGAIPDSVTDLTINKKFYERNKQHIRSDINITLTY
ncbi:F-box and FNIP repeat-containing protein [Cotonvirus japonicus]|uniref:F-box and FNIP repeat-containing protein n=1 Tax=Cotonvirus japonicus TaxID=2811091 RepID=A0ABM7NQW9_9VIRU|nr:F-box and FNIP repeat-containing protein [Cotonvirus japonicus]BCS82552.1 F-box and FNIP repeat-containing protein [Cotonvirus japonicus]